MEQQLDTTTEQAHDMPALTKIFLSPERTLYLKCSPHTRHNINVLARYCAVGVLISGSILAAAITKFGFNGHPLSLLVTIPLAFTIYLFMERSVAMSKSTKKKKTQGDEPPQQGSRKKTPGWRIAIAVIFAIYNGFLIDSTMFSNEIAAAFQRKITAQEQVLQSTTDSLQAEQAKHRDRLHAKISEGEEYLIRRKNELIQEAEGLGVSHTVGIGQIYNVKLSSFHDDQREFERKRSLLLDEIARDDSAIAAIAKECKERKALVPSQISTGFIAQMDALHEVVLENTHSILLAVLFFLMCMVVELIPLIGKLQTDIQEYFKLAKGIVKAYAVKAEMENRNIIEQTEQRLKLLNNRTVRQRALEHSQILLKKVNAHHEEVLKICASHFGNVTEIENQLRERYPDRFNEDLQPVFSKVYARFHENEKAAQEYLPINSETPKVHYN